MNSWTKNDSEITWPHLMVEAVSSIRSLMSGAHKRTRQYAPSRKDYATYCSSSPMKQTKIQYTSRVLHANGHKLGCSPRGWQVMPVSLSPWCSTFDLRLIIGSQKWQAYTSGSAYSPLNIPYGSWKCRASKCTDHLVTSNMQMANQWGIKQLVS